MSRTVSDCMFLNLSSASLGSCVEDCLVLVLTVTDLPTRDSIVPLVHQGYYQAFANAVAHIDGGIKMFSRSEFKKEVTRLAVHCGLLALQEGIWPGQESLYTFVDVTASLVSGPVATSIASFGNRQH